MDWLNIVVYLVATLCTVLAVRHWRCTKVPTWQGMGLRFSRDAWLDLGAGLLIGTFVMGGTFVVGWVIGTVQMGGVQPPDLIFVKRLLGLPVFAFGEEVLFRSLMLSGLLVLVRRRWLAVTIMAFIFGLAHAGNPNSSPLSVLGNALGALMYAMAFLGSGGIWLPFGLHVAWNSVQGPILGFPVSGLDMGGLVQQTPVGSDLITGGSYGPEAGLVGMAFRLIAIALVAAWLSGQSAVALRQAGVVER